MSRKLKKSEHSTRLEMLPPDLLNLVTRLLGPASLVKLVLLSGNKCLEGACRLRGGVTELKTQSSRDIKILRFCPQLWSIAGLTHFHVGRYGMKDPSFPELNAIVMTLPTTMQDIRVNCRESFSAFLRPSNDLVDDAVAKSYCSSAGLVAISIKTRFPELRVLHIEGMGATEKVVDPLTMSRFLADLPNSISSLRICVGNLHIRHLPTVKVPSEILQNLQELAWNFTASPASQQQNGESAHVEPSKTSVDQFKWVSTMQSLRSLKVQINSHQPALVNALAQLTSLKRLDYLNSGHLDQFPPCLTRLRTSTDQSRLAGFLKTLQASSCYDSLLDLRLSTPFSVTPTVVQIYPIPPHLTNLSVFVGSSHSTARLDDLPTSLTALSVNLVLEEAQELHKLSSLTNLQSLELDLPINPCLSKLLPPSLQHLNTIQGRPGRFQELAHLPQHLVSFSGSVSIGNVQHPCFSGLKRLTPELVTERLRKTFMPHISAANLTLNIVYEDGALQTLPKDLEEIDTNRHHELAVDSVFDEDPQHLLGSLTSLRTGASLYIHSIQNIPQSLTKLDSPSLKVHFPQQAKTNPPSVLKDHSLPASMRSISLDQPKIFVAHHHGALRISFYPPLSNLPLLDTLRLQNIPHTHDVAILQLPNTITDLEIHFEDPAKASVLVAKCGPTWLPKLQRVALLNCTVPLRNFLPRFDQLTYFRADMVLVHMEMLPAFEDDFRELTDSTLSTHILRKLFPPRLRRTDMAFFAEWNKFALRKLPANLESAHLWYNVRSAPSIPSHNLGKYLPSGLKRLSLTSKMCAHFLDGKFLPRTLMELKVNSLHERTLHKLPCLVSLHINLSKPQKGLLTKAMMMELPHSLQSLFINAPSVESGVLHSLPPRLSHLSVRLSDVTGTIIDPASLPPSLVVLKTHGWSSPSAKERETLLAKLPNLRFVSFGSDEQYIPRKL